MKRIFSFQNAMIALLTLLFVSWLLLSVSTIIETSKYARRLADARKTCILAGYDDATSNGDVFAKTFTCVKSVPLDDLEDSK